jgi:hypothetical protein
LGGLAVEYRKRRNCPSRDGKEPPPPIEVGGGNFISNGEVKGHGRLP